MKTIKVTEKEVQAAFDAAKSEETKQILTTLFGQQKETAKSIVDNYKQFDLERYLENPNLKVVTRLGCNVRILCTDRISNAHSTTNQPVVALVLEKGSNECTYELTFCYTRDGLCVEGVKSPYDLFFVPEKKEGWVNLFNLSEGPCLGRVYSSKEVAESMIKCGLHPYIATVKIEWEE